MRAWPIISARTRMCWRCWRWCVDLPPRPWRYCWTARFRGSIARRDTAGQRQHLLHSHYCQFDNVSMHESDLTTVLIISMRAPAVRPSLSCMTCPLAFFCSSSAATASLLLDAAMCNGVAPNSSLASSKSFETAGLSRIVFARLASPTN